jgi:hypothetical protein
MVERSEDAYTQMSNQDVKQNSPNSHCLIINLEAKPSEL